ncbi:MAG: pilin [Candidatus Gracilibacteria bacterium]|nr:pilin [Candidatus Gracilibacteria bacterium]
MSNFIKRFSLVMGIFFLAVSCSSSFAQAATATVSSEITITPYTAEAARSLPIDNLKIELTKAENKATKLETQIRDLAKKIQESKTKLTAAECKENKNAQNSSCKDQAALDAKKALLQELNSKELIPLRLDLNSRDTANLKGMITIQGQGIFADAASFLGSIIDYLIKFVGSVALILIVVGGVRLVVAAGDDNAVQNAKQMITYAIIGLAVALLAYIIVTFVHGLLYR